MLYFPHLPLCRHPRQEVAGCTWWLHRSRDSWLHHFLFHVKFWNYCALMLGLTLHPVAIRDQNYSFSWDHFASSTIMIGIFPLTYKIANKGEEFLVLILTGKPSSTKQKLWSDRTGAWSLASCQSSLFFWYYFAQKWQLLVRATVKSQNSFLFGYLSWHPCGCNEIGVS